MRLIWSLCLLLISVLFIEAGTVARIPAPFASGLHSDAVGVRTFDYNARDNRSSIYDNAAKGMFAYDAASILSETRVQNGNGNCDVLLKLPEFLAAKGPLRVDPADLRLPPTRAEGADPFKLADQIKKYGTSTEGMPPIQVTRGANGEMMINDGVTRATRGAMTPGTTVPVQVIEENPALNLGNLPKVGERTPGRP